MKFSGRPVLAFDGGAFGVPPVPVANGDDATDGNTFLALGYRQTVKPAAAGGKLLNANGFRFAAAALGDIAASFAGKPFITGHDWGDVRARGGTIVDAYAADVADDDEAGKTVAIYYKVRPTADWAIEGLANGTIDRFSLGVVPVGEVICTVHDVPVWTDDCWCLPGETVTLAVEGKDGEIEQRELIAEWEYQGGVGVELSAVNVPAVDGTHIVDAREDDDEEDEDVEASAIASRRRKLRELAAVCGRRHREQSTRSHQRTPPAAAPASAPAVVEAIASVEVAAVVAGAAVPDATLKRTALALGLGADASDHDVAARVGAMVDAGHDAHVALSLERLNFSHGLRPDEADAYRAIARAHGRAAFDATIELARSRPPMERAPTAREGRAALQSDAVALRRPGDAGAGANAEFDDGLDAYELYKDNPALPKLMKACRITAADIRKHGPRSITVVPQLAELIAATNSR